MSRTQFCLLAAFALLIRPALQAEPRTFTSTDGRSLEAEIVAASNDSVSLKLANGQTITSGLGLFSPADQKFIADWRKKNPVKINYAFQISYTKEKTDTSKVRRGNETVTTESWICKIKVANRSGQDLENLKLDYSIFYNQMDSGKPVLRKRNGSVTLPAIRNNEEVTLPTEDVKLQSVQLDGGFYYTDGSRSRQKDSLAGMTVSFKHSSKEVFQWASQGMEGKTSTAPGTQGSLSR